MAIFCCSCSVMTGDKLRSCRYSLHQWQSIHQSWKIPLLGTFANHQLFGKIGSQVQNNSNILNTVSKVDRVLVQRRLVWLDEKRIDPYLSSV